MLKFPALQKTEEPPLPSVSLEDYAAFCAFCMENNPKLTPQNCLEQNPGKESITEPFRIPSR